MRTRRIDDGTVATLLGMLIGLALILATTCGEKKEPARTLKYYSYGCEAPREVRDAKAVWILNCTAMDKSPTAYAASDEEEHDLGAWVRACSEAAEKIYSRPFNQRCLHVCSEGSGCEPCENAIHPLDKAACAKEQKQ